MATAHPSKAEVYLRAQSPDQADWVTELQVPISH
jgi:hypothetical protein